MQEYDVIILGGGTAGMTAAMFAARAGMRTIVVEQMGAGGQVVNAEHIENFPGLTEGVAGIELGPLLHEQAEAAGAEVLLDMVEAVEPGADGHIVRCADAALTAPAVIVAMGSSPRMLGVKGEAELAGRGISHCASCDGPLFRGKDVAVAGGGDSAVDEAIVAAQHAAKVTLFHRGPALLAQAYLVERAEGTANIEIVGDSEVAEILGSGVVEGVRIKSGTGQTSDLAVSALFVYVGTQPNTGLFEGVLDLDESGHIKTDLMMRSSVPGIFAAGDIRAESVAELAASAGDGATAAVAAVRYIKGRHLKG